MVKKTKIRKGAKRPAPRLAKTNTKVKGLKEDCQIFTIINEKLSHLENQALKAYDCLQAIKKRSTPDWKEWVNKLSPQDWMALANAQRERISHEVRRLADEILSKIHSADVLEGKERIVAEAKSNLENLVNKIDRSRLIDKTIDTAIHTKDGLLAFLNIPTHEEMMKLQRKLNRLERKLNDLKPCTS